MRNYELRGSSVCWDSSVCVVTFDIRPMYVYHMCVPCHQINVFKCLLQLLFVQQTSKHQNGDEDKQTTTSAFHKVKGQHLVITNQSIHIARSFLSGKPHYRS